MLSSERSAGCYHLSGAPDVVILSGAPDVVILSGAAHEVRSAVEGPAV
jgi:hypothetical protein